MDITSQFDGGNIMVESIQSDSTSNRALLSIRPDSGGRFLQWFYFRVQGSKNLSLNLEITNAHEAFSTEGWNGYQACASYDRINWFRCPSHFDGRTLSIHLVPKHDSLFFAYFPPFSFEQHLSLIARAQMAPNCQLKVLGKTVEKRNIDLLQFGQPKKHKKNVWILGRQHAGEAMASWFVKGLVDRILDRKDPVVQLLLNKLCFYVVPSMNLDGAIAGNIRVNGAGKDLNREWENPSQECSPEVYWVKNEMQAQGVDLCFDIHGDEELPYNFVSRIDGIPNFNEELAHKQKLFSSCWKSVCPDFQDVHGYPIDKPGKANLSICSKNIAYTFNCLALTVEMPFKDNADLPDPEMGWSIARSEKLGASLLNALLLYFQQV